MLGLVVGLLLSIMPVAGAQVADDSGESVELQAFTDTANSVFRNAIDQLAARGITLGCNPPANTRFCPDDPVTRGQMAIFIVRGFDVGPASFDFFDDDAGKVYEDAANRLAQAGLTQGCGPRRFCGDNNISRGEMAAFLTRALRLPAPSRDFFVDDNNSIFENGINRVAQAGITVGCNPPANTNFCPNDNVTRGQMAAFIIRALTGGITPPPPGGGTFCDKVTTVVKGDCNALVSLYNSTGGSQWTSKAGWMVSTNPCNWAGVACNAGKRVTQLILNGEASNPGNLTGSLPAALGNLTGLQVIDLASNEIGGTIPPALGNLKNLLALDLSGNFLTGTIPNSLGGLTALTVELDLHSNSLSGSIPTTFTNLNALFILDLGSNSLSGDLAVLGTMPSLRQIDLRSNNFLGAVPGVIGNLQFLNRLDLSLNGFTAVQGGIGNSQALNDIDLSDNNLTGFNPAFASIETLTELDLSFNNMTGPIPDGMDQLGLLSALDVSSNQLNDMEIPLFRLRGVGLEELLLFNNTCLRTTDLLNYNYIKTYDPAWGNCGFPAPPPAP